MSNKTEVFRPVIVEGKYDKIKLESVIDALIITTDGFGIFNSPEKQDYIRRAAIRAGGVIVATDSDGAGLVIRNLINSILPLELVTHVYIPQTEGRERRKKTPSKEGYLGLEGTDADTLREIFASLAEGEKRAGRRVDKTDLYNDGLLGKKNSSIRRKALAKKLSLPDNISSSALLDALNLLCSYEEYRELANALPDENAELL